MKEILKRFVGPRDKNIFSQQLMDINDLTEAMGRFTSELKTTFNNIISKIEYKAKELESLIAEADKRIEKLNTQEPISAGIKPVDEGNKSVSQTYRGSTNFKERYQEIFDLNDQGLDIDKIAKKTNMDKGEIQLILNLRKKV